MTTPSSKKIKIEVKDHTAALSDAVLSVVWSFVHILDIAMLVPNKAHHRASRTAQRQLERFHFDERWHAALNASNGIGLQRRLATLAVSRYNSETVRELCIYIRNLTMNLDILLMPIIRHFDRVETVLFVTDADTSTHYGIGVALLSGRHIEKVAIGMESERDAGIQWRDILVAIDSPHFRHLDIRYTDSQFVFTAALAPTMLRQLRILDIDFDPDDVDSILKQTSQVHSLRVRCYLEQPLSDVLRLLTPVLITRLPGIRALELWTSEDVDYPPVNVLERLLPLARLEDFVFRLKPPAKWLASKPSVAFDAFLQRALQSWPSLEVLDLALPVTSDARQQIHGCRVTFAS